MHYIFSFFQWTDEEMEKIFEAEQRKFGQGLNAFYQYRSLFAPLIEGLILLDRLVFLLEQVRSHGVVFLNLLVSPLTGILICSYLQMRQFRCCCCSS